MTYTWQDCRRDLALTTNMTLQDAMEATWELELSNLIDPAEAMPIIRSMANSECIAGWMLVKLIKAGLSYKEEEEKDETSDV